MKRELKVRINNPDEIAEKLLRIGAVFSHEDRHFYTYLKQPKAEFIRSQKTAKDYLKLYWKQKTMALIS